MTAPPDHHFSNKFLVTAFCFLLHLVAFYFKADILVEGPRFNMFKAALTATKGIYYTKKKFGGLIMFTVSLQICVREFLLKKGGLNAEVKTPKTSVAARRDIFFNFCDRQNLSDISWWSCRSYAGAVRYYRRRFENRTSMCRRMNKVSST